MRIAFSCTCCPQWDLTALAGRAKGLGYDGVELCAFANSTANSAANVLVADPKIIRETLAGVGVSCITSDICIPNASSLDPQTAQAIKRVIDAAAELSCPLVSINDMPVRGGQSYSQAAAILARLLRPHADYAVERGVTLLIANTVAFRRASHMWAILEYLNHPAVGACWNVLSAALMGEMPAISVPVLNSRMLYVQVADAKIEKARAVPCPLGDGSIGIPMLINRLKGIGYKGWVTVTSAPGDATTSLGESLKRLRNWITPPAPEAKPKPAKPAGQKPLAAKPPAAQPAAAPTARAPAEPTPA
jgi:sugar phosphate isomerase/epimerase